MNWETNSNAQDNIDRLASLNKDFHIWKMEMGHYHEHIIALPPCNR